MWMLTGLAMATTLTWTPEHGVVNDDASTCEVDLDEQRWRCDEGAWHDGELAGVLKAQARVDWWREAQRRNEPIVGTVERSFTLTLPAGELTVVGGSRALTRLETALERLIAPPKPPAAAEGPWPAPVDAPADCDVLASMHHAVFPAYVGINPGPSSVDVFVCSDGDWHRFEAQREVGWGTLDAVQREALDAAIDATQWTPWESGMCLEYEPMGAGSVHVAGRGSVSPGTCRWGPGSGEQLEGFLSRLGYRP